MSSLKEVFDRLAEPFPDNQVRTRIQAGRELRYITARTARQRLNDVLGPENWECRIEPGPNWVKCTILITIHVPEDAINTIRVITREALGGYPDMPKEEDRVKGGDSDAFKRCCVLFGIGEHLYGEDWHAEHPPVSVSARPASPPRGMDRPPAPASASAPASAPRPLPFDETVVPESYAAAQPVAPSAPGGSGPGRRRAQWPRDGRQFYAWLKNMEEIYSWPTVTKEVYTNFGPYSTYKFPAKYSEWNGEQVDVAATFVAQEATRKEAYQGEFDERLGRQARS